MFKWDRFLRSKKLNIKVNYPEHGAGYDEGEIDFENLPQTNENQTKDKEEYEVVEIEILPAKIICPDCGGITLEGLEFCDKCGGEL